mmetsp:Transcript_14849/g.28045  ORF Transcript_14849/g.28045 Transcript_14849/m.28045 type:complete len:442 (-) Transcript_14849:61-1386(-)
MAASETSAGPCAVEATASTTAEASVLAAGLSPIRQESALQLSQSSILSSAPASESAFATSAVAAPVGPYGNLQQAAYAPGPYGDLQQAAYAPGPAPFPPDTQPQFMAQPQFMVQPQFNPSRWQVELEDCCTAAEAATGVANPIPWPSANIPGGSPLGAHTLGLTSKQDKETHREVYVQNPRDADRFKPVPVHRLNRQLRREKASATQSNSTAQRSAFWASCMAIDADAAQLQTSDRIDADILELIARAEQSQVSIAAMFFTLQALLAGFAAVAGLMWLSAGQGNSGLQSVLAVLEPGLGGCNLVLGELALIGSSLRLFRAWDIAVAADGGAAAGRPEDHHSAYYTREVYHKTLIPAARTLSNSVFVLCCLLSSRGNVVLLHRTSWLDGGDWPGDLASNLLAVRSVSGCLALAFAYTDLFEIMPPRLPTSSSAAAPDDAMRP